MRMMCQGYGWMGWLSFIVSQSSFFIVMIDFGFLPNELLFKNAIKLSIPNDGDFFNPTSPTFGNTAISGISSC
jgi:hypothetical protein